MLATSGCLICDKPLTYHQTQTSNLCGNLQCRWSYSRVPSHQICTVCARPLSHRDLAPRVCQRAECQRVWCAERRKREREELEQIKERARVLRDQQAAAVGIQTPEKYPLFVIPSFSSPITNVAERRRRALRDRVTRLISRATLEREVPAASTTSAGSGLQTLIGKACGQCQGRCCQGGGEHAYLTAFTIRRFMAAHPELRPRDVLQAYLDRVSNKTYRDSCIYHGTNGCGLSAEMRSDTCNQYFCEGLKEFRRSSFDASEPRAFFASASDRIIRNAAFVDEAESRPIEVGGTEF